AAANAGPGVAALPRGRPCCRRRPTRTRKRRREGYHGRGWQSAPRYRTPGPGRAANSTLAAAMLIGRDMACALDAARFALECGITPDPWQAKLLCSTSRRVLMLCSRQSGKSTTTALKALHTGLYEPGSLIVLLAPAQRQSAEMLRSIKMMHRE